MPSPAATKRSSAAASFTIATSIVPRSAVISAAAEARETIRTVMPVFAVNAA